MRSLCFFALGVLLLLAQTSIFPAMPSWIGNPDLLFILVIFVSLRLPAFQGGALILLFGLLMAIFSGIFLGLYPLIYLAVFSVVRLISGQLAIGEVTYQIPLVVACYLFMSSVVFMVTSVLAPEGILHWSWPALLLQMLMLAVLTMPLFYLFDEFMGWFDQRRPRWSLVGSASSGNRFATSSRGRRSSTHPGRDA